MNNSALTTNAISTVYTDVSPSDLTSVTKTGQGYVALTSTTSNYSGGFFINAGGVRIGDSANAAALGSGTITIGTSLGAPGANAVLNLRDGNTGYTLPNNIVLGSDAATLTIGARGTGVYRISGTITGTNDLRVAPANASATTAGGINVVFEGAVNIAGYIINRSEMLQTDTTGISVQSNLATTSIASFRGGIGSNVKGLVQENSNAASALTVTRDGTNATGDIITIGASGFIARNSGGGAMDLNSGTGGTGDFILQNNSSNGSTGLQIRTNNVVHTGKVINSGTGTGAVSISALLGQGVTEIVQASATSPLNISGNVNVGLSTKVIRNTGGAALNLTSTAVGNGNGVLVFANDTTVDGAITVSGTGTIRPGSGLENSGAGTGNVVLGTSI
ncbi:hypothetical protein, partial [Novosphingobium sp.]|uniref:beta strand repeat-containing protein n=1 Tax=Novosphingobium sp. TaxID=1874826 RepID=UPI002611BC05